MSEARSPGLTLLFHPDITRVGDRVEMRDLLDGGEGSLARLQLDFAPPAGTRLRPLADLFISRRPIRFAPARFGGIRIDCSETGTRVVANDDWIPKDRVFLGVEVERGVVLVLSNRIVLLLHHLGTAAPSDLPRFGLIGEHPRMIEIRHEIQRLAAETTPVFLRGEVGTGKKLIGWAIHRTSGRRERPFVAINMADDSARLTIPDLLARTAGGTLFVDGVDKMPAEAQNQLVEVVRAAEEETSVRVIAATARKPRGQESLGPLVPHLSGATIEVPALRQRREDIGRLLVHFLRQELEKIDALGCLDDPGPYSQPWLSVQVVARLASYEWPRNVRQLKRVARQLAVGHHERSQVSVGSEVELLLEGTATASSVWDWTEESSDLDADQVQRDSSEITEIELLAALRANRWQSQPTAAHLSISEETLFNMIEKLSEATRRRKQSLRSSPRTES